MSTETRNLTIIAIMCALLGALVFTGALKLVGMARGDTPALVDAGPPDPVVVADHAAPAAPPTVALTPCIDADGPGPAPCVASPLSEPRAYLDTAASARKVGWPLLGGAILFGLLVLAGKWVPWLNSGKRALYISGASAVVAAAVNAGFLGGDSLAMGAAAVGVLIALVQGDRTVAAQVKAAKAAV